MKKRYIASPLAVIVIAVTWNVALRQHTPLATAEEIQGYLYPEVKDPRHPIDVYQFLPTDGENRSDIITKIPNLTPEDNVNFIIEPMFGVGTIVHVHRAMPVTVKDGRKEFHVRTWADTVSELLGDMRRPLLDLDKANFNEESQLQPDMTIEITRVQKINVKEKEVIAFETVTKDDPNVYRPETKVKEAGQNGERTKTFEIIREDGDEISRKLIKNEVTKKPKSKVVVKGTKLKIGKVAEGSGTFYDICCTKVASRTFKKGTVLRLTNMSNGKQIEVTVDDTGAFDPNRVVVDLHPALFQQLGGTTGQGVIQRVKAEEILNP